ncbi:alpha/beta fold hydrolase [Legionella fairfieldensis]|uniref:alpha/beta fold hydrolase n=1 Tax=Legionella fairfieldensis TaxID=45064 RepID=UPI00048DF8BC|nr:alpha/beta hydrolase [Legionella fairfieldensis]
MHTSTLSIPGFTIAYKSWGDVNLPPLLALHGWLDNANSFDPLASYLSEHFHLIAIDLPGHGYSSHLPSGCYYHFTDAIFVTLQIIKALGFDQVHLLGHSMGACLASLVAGVAPEHILSLMLIEGLGPFSSPEQTCREQLAYYGHYLKSNAKRARSYSSPLLAAQARAKQGYLSLEYIEILCQRGLEKKGEVYYWRHDRRLLNASPLRMTENQILSCLEGIVAKSFLIWADQGFAFHDQIMRKRMQAVKHLKVIELAGGHHVHMEKPDAVAQRLIEFSTLK